MKKNYLIALFAMICSFASAQIEPTTYRGAFAPAPAAQWTDSWTNFDPKNATYPASTVTVAGGNITENTTWSASNTYTITGPVYVTNGATLTIEPGTVIYGDNNISYLVITRGSKINAAGTAANPIVFTSNKTTRTKGDWGGIIVLGNGLFNFNSGVQHIEGVTQDLVNLTTQYGGGANPVNDDNSGVMQYVRIEFGGVPLAGTTNNEINGLTMGAVGSGTTIDHIQVSYCGDDAFEWFGGSVNCKYLVSFATYDDDFDTDAGFNGNVQFGLVVRDPGLADQSKSNAFESDNNNTTGFLGTSFTSASFYNVTVVGPTFRSTTPDSNYQFALHLRRNTQLKIYNSVFMDYTQGLRVDGLTTEANALAGNLIFNNNLIAKMTSNAATATLAASANGVSGFGTATAFNTWYDNGGNTTLASSAGLLTQPYDTNSSLVYTGLDYRPAAVTAPSVTSSTISYNQGDVATQLSATAASGNTLKWYTVSTGGTAATTAPTPATTVAGTTTYYVAQTSAMGVESARTAISVTVNTVPVAAPAVISTRNYVVGNTAFPLSATATLGNTLKWYTVPTGGTAATTAPTPATTTVGTTTYYVSQTSIWDVESERTSITVTVEPVLSVAAYRGAFAPAPAAQWTDSWTNFDPKNATYPASTVTVAGGNITTDTTWSSANTYTITGPVYVTNGATLTIEPGTVIYGDNNISYLVITRGSKINAAGTAANPIVFTSNKTTRTKGDWGGIIVLGNGLFNFNSGVQHIEGVTQDLVNLTTQYGGGANPVNDDNSGVMQYVRIEFGGVPLAGTTNNEINGLTMGAVGSGTTIDHIQVSYCGDDAFEWFGGSVNCKYLVSFATYDDDFDTDAGFNGNVQFGLVVRDPGLADQSKSNAFESDNNNTTGFLGTSFTSASFYNVTVVGPTFRSTTPDSNYQFALHLRRNTQLKIYNSVFMDYTQGLRVDGLTTEANALAGNLIFNNNLIAKMTSNAATATLAASANGVSGFGTATAFNTWYDNGGNTTLASSAGLLTQPYDTNSSLVYTGLDYRPAAVTAPSVTSSTISYNQGDVATQLSATAASGNTLKWYTVATGGTAATTAPTPATTTVGTTTYYVAQTSAMGVESARVSISVNVTPAAPTAASQTFCAGATVASLSATGTAIKWYDTNEATTPLTTTTALSSATYYASQTVSGAESTRTEVSVTVTPLTTTGSVTTSICAGDSYTWPANGVTYTTAQTGVTVVSDCNTATLNLTIQAAPIAGTNGVIYLNPGVIPTNAQLFAGLNGNPTVGGTWSNVANVYTYTVAATSPCTVAATATVTVSESIPATLTLCKGAKISNAVLDSSLKFYTALTKGTPLAATTALTSKTLYATQTINGSETNPRVPVVFTILDLVAAPTLSSTETKRICKYIGTDNLVTFTATPALGTTPTSYSWTVPSGATIDGPATGSSVQVNFYGANSVAGSIGNITVDAKNTLGCPSGKPKALALTTSVPKAPKSVALSSTAPVTTLIEGLPVTTITAVKKAGNFVGTTNILYMIVTDPSLTADHYDFTLPEGVSDVTGATAVGNSTTLYTTPYTGTSTVLTFNLEGVQASNTALAFTATSVAGCGASSKILSVVRAEAGTPKGLALTDATLADANATPPVLPIAVKKLDSYTGSLKNRYLTLTATPNTSAGSEASSYRWVLPAAASTTATPYVENDVVVANTYTSNSTSISVNLANVGSETEFIFKVFGVNGNGRSVLSKDITLKSAAPKAPAAIYAGSSGSGTLYTTYNKSCGIVTMSVPAVLGVSNSFATTTSGVSIGVVVGNTVSVNFTNAPSALKSTVVITATATTATGSTSKIFTIKLGASCSAPSVRIAPAAASATEKFSAFAYPNPSIEGFRVKSSNGKSFGVQVYDMLGRSIEQRQISSDSEIGSNYAKGIYNVIVNQGANVKTLRVIKQ